MELSAVGIAMLGREYRVAVRRQRLHQEGRLRIAAAVAMRENNYRPRLRGLAVRKPGVDREPRDLKFLRNRESLRRTFGGALVQPAGGNCRGIGN